MPFDFKKGNRFTLTTLPIYSKPQLVEVPPMKRLLPCDALTSSNYDGGANGRQSAYCMPWPTR